MAEIKTGAGKRREIEPVEVPVVDSSNKEVSRLSLPRAFSSRVNDYLMFDQVLAQRASNRAGTAATKTRGKIRGGGAKPWKQKGTGRARAGSSRSPIWRGGGTIFGPQPRSFGYRLPRKARRAALASALSQKARDGQVKVVDNFSFEAPCTKQMKELLNSLSVSGSVLVVLAEMDANVALSARNLRGVSVVLVDGVNVYDLLKHETLLLAPAAVEAIERRLAA
ncbi:MAG: 50S ribosomal protein L4 [Proteobacteria bacterium]|nr:50S ribosomal protein L4 [Pseudomonadota bacterium]